MLPQLQRGVSLTHLHASLSHMCERDACRCVRETALMRAGACCVCAAAAAPPTATNRLCYLKTSYTSNFRSRTPQQRRRQQLTAVIAVRVQSQHMETLLLTAHMLTVAAYGDTAVNRLCACSRSIWRHCLRLQSQQCVSMRAGACCAREMRVDV